MAATIMTPAPNTKKQLMKKTLTIAMPGPSTPRGALLAPALHKAHSGQIMPSVSTAPTSKIAGMARFLLTLPGCGHLSNNTISPWRRYVIYE
jgi:hypothetical protein